MSTTPAIAKPLPDMAMPLKTKTQVRVEELLSKGGDALKLEVIAGSGGLQNAIVEPAINRPGLALTGFYEYFANKRIQVLGAAENAYLSAMGEGPRRECLRVFMSKRIPCVVVSRNKRVFAELKEFGEAQQIPVLRTRLVTKDFINSATMTMENLQAPRAKVQGTMVEIMGIGVLIRGKAGMGKSEAALALIRRGHALVSDDITALRLDSSGTIMASAVDVTRYHMEIRGLGIIHVPSLFGVASVRAEKRLDLVITLVPFTEGDDNADRSGTEREGCDILGLVVPEIRIPVAAGRELVNVIETAALDQKLRQLGHDASKEFDERLMNRLAAGTNKGSE